MKHCFGFLLTAMFVATVANAQLVNNGATITIQSGATIKCTGAIINNSSGIINNAGTMSSDSEIRNESGGALNGAGVYEATTKFINNGVALAGINLKLIGSSNTDSIKSGAGSSYTNVNLAKGPGNTATLSDAMTVNGAITFENDNNSLIIEDENLTMGAAATFVSADNNEFVVTNSTGTVTKQGLGSTPFTFEVGFGSTPTEYNYLTVTNSGTVNNISVRCMQNVLLNGTSGAVLTSDFAANSWVVSQSGSGSNLSLTANWVQTDELSNFNRSKVGIARFNTGTDWDLPASSVTAASGPNPYTLSRSGISTLGVFAVADLDKVNSAKLSLKVILQGANYNAATGLMADLLRDDPLTGPLDPVIPTTQPYTAAFSSRFDRIGIYDGTSTVNETINPTVFNTTGNNAIVDWVYISTLDPTTPSTKLQTRAALLQRDGDIVDLDGVSPVSVPIDNDGNYHILVGHRNHLSVRTPVTKVLADNTVFAYNFSSAQTQAFQTVTPPLPPNAAMKDLGGGAFALWGGNANANNTIKYGGSQNDPGTVLLYLGSAPLTIANNVYSASDVNMNRIVRYGGNGNDPGSVLLFLGSIPLAIFTEHL